MTSHTLQLDPSIAPEQQKRRPWRAQVHEIPMTPSPPLPASSTKHLDLIHHPLPRDPLVRLPLRQISATTGKSTGTTGTTLWLGAQVLACYLALHPPVPAKGQARPRCVELGAGIGYLSLFMASLGWDVVATDIEPVLSAVLVPNVEAGMGILRARSRNVPVFNGRVVDRGIESVKPINAIGNVTTRYVDWEGPPDWLLKDKVHLIITSDTIYHLPLLEPLFKTVVAVSNAQASPPTIVLALERRDSRLVDHAMDLAKEWGISLKRIGQGRVAKSVEKSGWGWKDEDWEGVEIYKGRYIGNSVASGQGGTNALPDI